MWVSKVSMVHLQVKSSWALLSFRYMWGHTVERNVVPHRTTVQDTEHILMFCWHLMSWLQIYKALLGLLNYCSVLCIHKCTLKTVPNAPDPRTFIFFSSVSFRMRRRAWLGASPLGVSGSTSCRMMEVQLYRGFIHDVWLVIHFCGLPLFPEAGGVRSSFVGCVFGGRWWRWKGGGP